MERNEERQSILYLTADIVASHISNNTVDVADLQSLIKTVYGTLSDLSNTSSNSKLHSRTKPAVAIEDSIQPDYLVCLEDGRELKMLKRHLRSAYNMSPDEYRQRWDLPPDYPMVAPNYAKKRSSLALESGLGRSRAAS